MELQSVWKQETLVQEKRRLTLELSITGLVNEKDLEGTVRGTFDFERNTFSFLMKASHDERFDMGSVSSISMVSFSNSALAQGYGGAKNIVAIIGNSFFADVSFKMYLEDKKDKDLELVGEIKQTGEFSFSKTEEKWSGSTELMGWYKGPTNLNPALSPGYSGILRQLGDGNLQMSYGQNVISETGSLLNLVRRIYRPKDKPIRRLLADEVFVYRIFSYVKDQNTSGTDDVISATTQGYFLPIKASEVYETVG